MPNADPGHDIRVTRAIERNDAAAFCHAILPYVSRTFAIGIRILRGVKGHAVLDAYLLCRIVDTIEDAPQMDVERKAALVDHFIQALTDTSARDVLVEAAQSLPGESAHILLLRQCRLVFAHYDELPETTRAIIAKWVREMATGMRKFVLLYPDGIRISTIEEYREYCYYVAGTVGYMLTDIWHAHSGCIDERLYLALRERSGSFGEALQAVNILKDVEVDARDENSIYIPEDLLRGSGSSHATMLTEEHLAESREALQRLIQLAWRELEVAREYLLLLPRRAVTVRMFCTLPLLLAYATLRELSRDGVMLSGGRSVRISRREVKSILAAAWVVTGSNRALSWLVERIRREAFAPFA